VGWLLGTVEALLHGKGKEEFVKSSKVWRRAFIAQRCTNCQGPYLAPVEYKGGVRRAFIIIPERHEGKGWNSYDLVLRKALSF
jgi:hypothetical protein